MPRIQRKTKNNGANNGEEEDKAKSMEDWSKLDVESLKLTCNVYGVVATGKKKAIVERIYKHFNPTPIPIASEEDLPIHVNNEAPIQTANIASTSSDTISTNEIMLELKALRSMVSNIKKKQDDQEQQPQVLHQSSYQLQPTPTGNAIESVAGLQSPSYNPINSGTNTVAVHGFQIPHFMNHTSEGSNTNVQLFAQNQSTSNSTSGNNNNISSYNDNSNPFVPPPMKASILKKIEKMEFIDFEDLVSNRPSAITAHNELYIVSDDTNSNLQSSPLMLRQKENKGRVTTLANWLMAWNKYMQATLHYKPHLFYELFCYQKNFCMIANKHKFESCYMYDKDFRLQIASQGSLRPEQRSVKWETFNLELSNVHLQPDTMLSACFHCKVVGHFSSACPTKNFKSTGASETFRNAQTNNPGGWFPTNNNQPTIDPSRFNNANRFPNQPQGRGSPCNRFNRGIYCAKPPCTFAHICNKCKQSHPGIRCNSTTNTSFLPQFQ